MLCSLQHLRLIHTGHIPIRIKLSRQKSFITCSHGVKYPSQWYASIIMCWCQTLKAPGIWFTAETPVLLVAVLRSASKYPIETGKNYPYKFYIGTDFWIQMRLFHLHQMLKTDSSVSRKYVFQIRIRIYNQCESTVIPLYQLNKNAGHQLCSDNWRNNPFSGHQLQQIIMNSNRFYRQWALFWTTKMVG